MCTIKFRPIGQTTTTRRIKFQYFIFIFFQNVIFLKNAQDTYSSQLESKCRHIAILVATFSIENCNHHFLFLFQITCMPFNYEDSPKWSLPVARPFAWTNIHLLFFREAVVVFTLKNMYHGPTVTRTLN